MALRAQQQQEVNNFGSSNSMSLQTYAADYWPGMHTTALWVVLVNADIFWRQKGKTFLFSVGLLPCKCGLIMRGWKVNKVDVFWSFCQEMQWLLLSALAQITFCLFLQLWSSLSEVVLVRMKQAFLCIFQPNTHRSIEAPSIRGEQKTRGQKWPECTDSFISCTCFSVPLSEYIQLY